MLNTLLLQAQVQLVDSEDRETHVGTRIVVRGGEVTMEMNELVKSVGRDLVLIGAPVPLEDHGSVAQLVAVLVERTGAQVEIVDPQVEAAK